MHACMHACPDCENSGEYRLAYSYLMHFYLKTLKGVFSIKFRTTEAKALNTF